MSKVELVRKQETHAKMSEIWDKRGLRWTWSTLMAMGVGGDRASGERGAWRGYIRRGGTARPR